MGNMMHRFFRASAVALVVVVAGCGGGGGDDDDDESTYNAAAAWQALATPQTATRLNVTGPDSEGDTWTFVQADLPAGPSVYPRTGIAGFRNEQSGVVAITGFETLTFLGETYYTAPGQVIGFRYPESPENCEDVVTTQPPTAARVGDSGPLYTSTEYSDCTPGSTSVAGRTTATWSIKSINNTPYFCTLEQNRDPSGADLGSLETCVQVATDGSVGPAARLNSTEPGTPPFTVNLTGTIGPVVP